MRREEPGIGRHVDPAADIAGSVRTAIIDQQFHLVDHAQSIVGKRRSVRDRERLPAGAFFGRRYVQVRIANSDLIGQRLGREEPEVGVSAEHRTGRAIDDEVEGHDDHAGRLRHPGEGEVGGENAGVGVHRSMLHRATAEIAEAQVDVARERGAEVGGEPAARLQRHLEQHCIGHRGLSILREVPRGLGHRVLRDHARAGLDVPGAGVVELDDALEELIGRSRQPRDPAITVEWPEARTEGI